jgi:hypothetical protein
MNKDKWTIKEIADLISVSKTTIQKTVKELNIEPDLFEKNKQYFYYPKVKLIILKMRPGFDFSSLQTRKPTENQTENLKTESANQFANSQTESEKSTTESANSKTKNLSDDSQQDFEHWLLEENKFLKDQIKQKDQLINDLNENLRIAQQLAAADKKRLLELEDKTGSEVSAEDQQPPEHPGEPAEDQPDQIDLEISAEENDRSKFPEEKNVISRFFSWLSHL